MTKQDVYLLKLCSDNKELYNVTKLFDKYDLGGTGSDEPGEYILEGKEFVHWYRKGRAPSKKKVLRFVADMHKKKFSILINPKFRYREITNKLIAVMEITHYEDH